MNEAAIVRIAAATNAHRPDWPQSSLVTFLTKNLADRAYQDVAVAMAWIATDPETRTPARVLEPGPWWPAHTEAGTTPTPTKLGDMRCRCGAWVVRGEPHRCGQPADVERTRKLAAAARAEIRRTTTEREPEGDE